MRTCQRLLAITAGLFGSIAPAIAQDTSFVLTFDQTCSYKARTVECAPSTKIAEIFFRGGKWYGVKDEITPEVVLLQVIRDDASILILGNPVNFSGSSIVHLMKGTGAVYWSEISYSEVLRAEGASLLVGKFSKRAK